MTDNDSQGRAEPAERNAPADGFGFNRRSVLRSAAIAGGIGVSGCLGFGGGDGEYPSDDITFVVPYSAGGGFDQYSRAVAEYMPEHLPTDANVVVQNVTGGGGARGANQVYDADPDGYTIGMFNLPSFIVSQVIIGTDYDMNEVTWLGSVVDEPLTVMVSSESDYESIEELGDADEPLRWGSTGPSSAGTYSVIIAGEEMGFPYQLVYGFEGSSEMIPSMVRGEIVGYLATISSVRTPVEDGDGRLLYVFGSEAPEYAPDVQTAAETEYEDLIGINSLHRSIGGPPEMEDDVTETLRTALMDTLESDAMQTWGEENDRPIRPASGEDVSQTVETSNDLLNRYSDILEEEMTQN